MDDVWLPIMHSAMDTRSNANLFTVTNDALKDPEPESDVSDMWRHAARGVQWQAFYRHVPAPSQRSQLQQWARSAPWYFYQYSSPAVAPLHEGCASKRSEIYSYLATKSKQKRTVTHRLPIIHTVLVWHQILWFTLMKLLFWGTWLKCVCVCVMVDWQIAIRSNQRNHNTCDVQLPQTW